MMRRRLYGAASAFVLAGLIFSAAPSCGPGFLDGIAGGAGDATVGTVKADAVDCARVLAPERPLGMDVAAPSDLKLGFALDALRLDTGGGADASLPPPRGLDLDQTCTCPEAPSCTGGAGAGCDGDGGRDNALAPLFNSLGLAVGQFQESFATTRIREGRFTVLIDVGGWNGQPDDPSVLVTLRMSQQFDKTGNPDGRTAPRFDGADVWTVDPASIGNGDGELGKDCRADAFCFATIRDNNAFVRGGKLVARLHELDAPNTPIVVRTSLGALVIDLDDTTLVADIADAGAGRYQLVGEISGRWPTERFIVTIGDLEQFLRPGTRVCEDTAGYATVKAAICDAADVATAPSKDRTGAPCSAISSALSFSATMAVAGHVFRKDEIGSPCGSAVAACP